jgi:hypothetical protein
LANRKTRRFVDREACCSVKLLCLSRTVEGRTFDIRDGMPLRIEALRLRQQLLGRDLGPIRSCMMSVACEAAPSLRVKDRIARIMAGQIPILFAQASLIRVDLGV